MKLASKHMSHHDLPPSITGQPPILKPLFGNIRSFIHTLPNFLQAMMTEMDCENSPYSQVVGLV